MKRNLMSRATSLVSAAALLLTAANTFPAGISAYADEEIVVCDSAEFMRPDIEINSLKPASSHTFSGSSYNQLDEKSKDIYSALYDLYSKGADLDVHEISKFTLKNATYKKSGSDTVFTDETNSRIDAEMSYSDFFDAYECLMNDHPEMYWLRTMSLSRSKYMNMSGITYDSKTDLYTCTMTVTVTAKFTKYNAYDTATINGTAKSDMDAAIANAKKVIGETGSPYLTLKGIHDYLCNTVDYNNDAAKGMYTDEQGDMYQTAYSAFFKCNGDTKIQTVCAGYTKGFKVLCDSYGIPCVVVTGTGMSTTGSEGHAWNLVQLGSKWYAVDCTWDDQKTKIYYDFFLSGSETLPDKGFVQQPFSVTHKANNKTSNSNVEIVTPALNATKYDSTQHGISLKSTTVDMSVSSVGNLSYSKSKFYDGDTVTVTAESKPGYEFVGWYKADTSSSVVKYTGSKLAGTASYTFTGGASDVALVAVYKPITSMNISLKGGPSGFTYTVNGGLPSTCTGSKNLTCNVGDTVTITSKDSGFICWENANNCILGRSKSYTFKVTGSTTVSAVCANTDSSKAVVNFVSAYDQVISRETYGSSDSPKVPGAPAKLNSTFKGWSVNGGATISASGTASAVSTAIKNAVKTSGIEDNTINVKAVYETNRSNVVVTVKNGTGGGTVNINDKITVKANAPASGKKFSHWVDGSGNIVSYSSTYEFYALKNVTLEAVYAASSVSAKGVARIDTVVIDKTNKKITAVGEFNVPDGCTIVTAGVLATSSSTVAKGDFNEFTADLASQNTADVTMFRFDRTMKISTGNESKTFYYRAYLVYADADGNLNKVYGNVVSRSLNG